MSLDIPGWANRSLGILPSTNAPSLVAYSESTVTFKEEGDEKMLTLGKGTRLNESGYITNAPLTLGENDYVHSIVSYSSGTHHKWRFDPRWQTVCAVATSGGGYGTSYLDVYASMKADLASGKSFKHYDTTERAFVFGDGCLDDDDKVKGNHYWVNESKGPYTVGCGDEEYDNYTTDADYRDDEICEYTCDDPNRLVEDNGKCGDCVEGYGLNDDGLCDASISTDLKLTLRGLPWGMIGGGVALLAVAKFGLPLLMSKKS